MDDLDAILPPRASGVSPVGVIGGTGVYDPTWLTEAKTHVLNTPYGAVTVTAGMIGDRAAVFVNRHGPGHHTPPHRVNYRANLWLMHALRVRHVVATTAVGAVNPAVEPGRLLLASQFLDFTKSRATTFFDGEDGRVIHVDVTEPYCRGLRRQIASAADELGIPVVDGGTYVATEGPRFESAAEIRAYRILGGDVVGMTGVPEVVLARELGICYATLCLSTNLAAGLGEGPLTHDEVLSVMARHQDAVRRLLGAVLPRLGRDPGSEALCRCPPAPLPLNAPGGDAHGQ